MSPRFRFDLAVVTGWESRLQAALETLLNGPFADLETSFKFHSLPYSQIEVCSAFMLARQLGKEPSSLQWDKLRFDIDSLPLGLPHYFYDMAAARVSGRFSILSTHEHLLELNSDDDWLSSSFTAAALRELMLKGQLEISSYREYAKTWLNKDYSNTHHVDCLLTEIGLASHLLPFGYFVRCPRYGIIGCDLVERLLAFQNSDGGFYPVLGGAACPDLNATNLLSVVAHDGGRVSRTKAQKALDQLARMLLSTISHPDLVWMSDGCDRSVEKNSLSSIDVGNLAFDWLTKADNNPSVWATLIRWCTILKLRKSEIHRARKEGFYSDHLFVWT